MIAAYPGKLQIVVLAAGFSSRLGQPKALGRVHGLSLLRRTLKAASGCGADRIIVVVPRNAARYRVEARGMKVLWAVNAQRARASTGDSAAMAVSARIAPRGRCGSSRADRPIARGQPHPG